MTGAIVAAGFALLVIIVLANTARIVPQKKAYIVERLGNLEAAYLTGDVADDDTSGAGDVHPAAKIPLSRVR